MQEGERGHLQEDTHERLEKLPVRKSKLSLGSHTRQPQKKGSATGLKSTSIF